MIDSKKMIVMAALLSFSAAAAPGVDIVANETPIHTVKNAEAVAKIPAGFKFVEPGTLTVAISLLGSGPPFGLYARDNKTVIGSEADIARLVADGLGLKLKLVPTSWEDWPLGVASGKYDAAVYNITVTNERKTKFDFATYRQDTLGFYVKSDSKITQINTAPDIAGKKIIVDSGTNQEAVLLAWDKENRAKAGAAAAGVRHRQGRLHAGHSVRPRRRHLRAQRLRRLPGAADRQNPAGRHRARRLAENRQHRRHAEERQRPGGRGAGIAQQRHRQRQLSAGAGSLGGERREDRPFRD